MFPTTSVAQLRQQPPPLERPPYPTHRDPQL